MKGMEFSEVSNRVIGCAIEVHRILGPGLLEATYQKALACEFDLNGLIYRSECSLPVDYKGVRLECGYRVDMIVESEILLELKSVETLTGVHEAQLLTYMKLAGIRQGFLINFNVKLLKEGLRSFLL